MPEAFRTKWLTRFARKEGLNDESLREALGRAEKGLIDADLGGGLIKQRVARQGKGRSGGFRTIVAYRRGERAVFLYAFAKSHRDNISAQELEDLRQLGSNWLSASKDTIAAALDEGLLEEIR